MKPWAIPHQEHTSAATCIKQAAGRTPAICKHITDWADWSINADIGGGSEDDQTHYLADFGVQNIVWDPFNRSSTHNEEAQVQLEGGQADTATLSNVLNVIKEREARIQTLVTAFDALKPGGALYVTIHYGDRSGVGRETTKGWQENRPAADYCDELDEVGFMDIGPGGKFITARKPIGDPPPTD